jgi:hypothetical protein
MVIVGVFTPSEVAGGAAPPAIAEIEVEVT